MIFCLLCSLLKVVLGLVVLLILGVKIVITLTKGQCKSRKKLNGYTVIVTGSNTGIGKETARDLAQRGARVILACRNEDKGNAARDDIIKTTGNQNVVFKKLDLSSLKSVREFGEDILKTESRLDILINNAGAGWSGYKLTEDGLEIEMQINHFGHFLLTNILVGLLKKSAPSRVVVVSARLYEVAKLELDNLNSEKSFNKWRQYPNTKLANILFTNELARRLEGTGVTVNSLHPGVVVTELNRNWPAWINLISKYIARFIWLTPVEGAQTTIYAAISDEMEGVTGKYLSDCAEVKLKAPATDMGFAKKLWELSEKCVKLQPSENHL